GGRVASPDPTFWSLGGDVPGCSYSGTGSSPPCSAADLRGNTCESIGFVGGTLACAPSYCRFDTHDCQTCVAGPRVSCASLDAGSRAPAGLAMGPSDQEIGLAWIDTTQGFH